MLYYFFKLNIKTYKIKDNIFYKILLCKVLPYKHCILSLSIKFCNEFHEYYN